MKHKNLVWKTLFSVCAGIVLLTIFMPLMQVSFIITESVSILDFFTNEGFDNVMEFTGNSDALATYRTIFGLMLLLQIVSVVVLWIGRQKARLLVNLIAGLYELTLGYRLSVALSENYAVAGAGLILLLIAGLAQIIFSVIFFAVGEKEDAEKKESLTPLVQDRVTGQTDEKSETSQGSLLAMAGQFAGASFPVGEQMMLLGRDGKVCNVILSGENISRKHCGIEYDSDRKVYHVYDYSTNGTFRVGGARLNPGMNEMEPGNAIQIGENQFVLQ